MLDDSDSESTSTSGDHHLDEPHNDSDNDGGVDEGEEEDDGESDTEEDTPEVDDDFIVGDDSDESEVHSSDNDIENEEEGKV